MKQTLAVFAVVLMLAAFIVPSVAMANVKHIKVYPNTSNTTSAWSNVLAAETLTTVTVPIASYDKVWLAAVVDSMASGSGAQSPVIVVQYRTRYSFNIDPATYYYGSWTNMSDSLYTAKALTCFSILGSAATDTLINRVNDLQLRAYGTAGNDSGKIRLYVECAGSR